MNVLVCLVMPFDSFWCAYAVVIATQHASAAKNVNENLWAP